MNLVLDALGFGRPVAGKLSQIDAVRFSLGVGLGVALVSPLSFALGQMFLLAGGRISNVSAIIILAFVLGLSLAAAQRLTRDWRAPAAVMAIIAFCAVLSGVVFDMSFDGQQYHYDSVASLAQGWNPFRDAKPMPDYAPLIGDVPVWSLHYPQAAWIAGALQLAAGLPAEATKSQALLTMAALFLVAFGLAREFGVGRIAAIMIGALTAANPILVVQLFTRMNDGLLGGGLALTLLFSTLWIFRRQNWAAVGAIASLVFTVNLKFSAIPLAAAVCIVICVLALWKDGMARSIRVGSVLLIAGVVGILVIGSHPYITNTITHGHPFYPVMGDAALEIMGKNLPASFEPLNGLQQVGASYFGATASGYYAPEEHLKLPFMIYPSELSHAGEFDTRIGGFGPWFSAGLVVAFVIAGVLLFRGHRTAATKGLLGVAGALLLLAVVFPEGWWARYVPQLWWAPILVAVAALVCSGRRLRLAGWALAGIIALNVAMVSVSSLKYVGERNLAMHKQFDEIRVASGNICMNVDYMHARIPLFNQLGDKVRVQSDLLKGCEPTHLAGDFQPREGTGYCGCP